MRLCFPILIFCFLLLSLFHGLLCSLLILLLSSDPTNTSLDKLTVQLFTIHDVTLTLVKEHDLLNTLTNTAYDFFMKATKPRPASSKLKIPVIDCEHNVSGTLLVLLLLLLPFMLLLVLDNPYQFVFQLFCAKGDLLFASGQETCPKARNLQSFRHLVYYIVSDRLIAFMRVSLFRLIACTAHDGLILLNSVVP